MPYITTDEVSEAEAQYYLALAYQNGSEGVPYDPVEAERLFRVSIENGNMKACIALARLYYHGVNVKQDYSESARLYRMAAVRGITEAQFELGNLYIMGLGVEKDMDVAITWWNDAALNGNESAHDALLLFLKNMSDTKGLNMLAKKYCEKGKELKAAEVWETGALMGDIDCQYHLGLVLLKGQRRSEGMDWLEKAAASGNEEAKKAISKVYEIDSEPDSIDSV
jgi:TPR repeat protein